MTYGVCGLGHGCAPMTGAIVALFLHWAVPPENPLVHFSPKEV
ncbi:MAG: hypothetical protein ACRD1R_12490 [Acidobacteriota bacterium]